MAMYILTQSTVKPKKKKKKQISLCVCGPWAASRRAKILLLMLGSQKLRKYSNQLSYIPSLLFVLKRQLLVTLQIVMTGNLVFK